MMYLGKDPVGLNHIIPPIGHTALLESGEYTPTETVAASITHIPHNLGVVPDFILVISDEVIATSDMTERYITNSYCGKTNLIISNSSTNGFCAYQTNWPQSDKSWQSPERINYTKFLHENNFEIPYYNSGDKLKGGITYHYVLGKFNEQEVTSNANE